MAPALPTKRKRSRCPTPEVVVRRRGTTGAVQDLVGGAHEGIAVEVVHGRVQVVHGREQVVQEGEAGKEDDGDTTGWPRRREGTRQHAEVEEQDMLTAPSKTRTQVKPTREILPAVSLTTKSKENVMQLPVVPKDG